MRLSPFLSRSSIASFLSLFHIANAQGGPGGTFYNGNGATGAGPYSLIDEYQPATFFDKFQFFTGNDPTNGHVRYVDRPTAERNSYAQVGNGNVRLNVDSTQKFPRGGQGRPAVRLISSNAYTHGLFVFDVAHMPTGCGTWPAYWLLGNGPDPWPKYGEIDIVEGVHTSEENGISMHTSPGCEMGGSDQTAKLQTSNCDVRVNQNSGCGSKLEEATIPNNYGKPLNDIGGGVYATEWTSNYVKHWFFPRNAIPSSITSGGVPDISQFGKPTVNQQGPGCTIDNHFTNMSIIINTSFCGDWAGNVYDQFPECPQNPSIRAWDACVDFVGNNPAAFAQAYWQINSIRVFQMPPGAQPSSSYTTSLSSTQPLSSTNTIDVGMGRSTTSQGSSSFTGSLSSVTSTRTTSPPSVSTPLICPPYNNTVWENFNGNAYTIACGSDFTGSTSGMPQDGVFSAKSFENCLEICDTIDKCSGVSFIGGNGAGTCYVKGNTDGVFNYDGSTNGAMKGSFPSASVSMPPEVSVTPGPDDNVPTSRPDDAPSPTTTMSPAGSASSCPGIDKQIITAPDMRKFRVYCSSDSNGSGAYDVKGFPDGSYDQCFNFCNSESDCTAFTWGIGATTGGTCFLKKGVQGPRDGPDNIITFIMVTGDEPPPDQGSSSQSPGMPATTSFSDGQNPPESTLVPCENNAVVDGSNGRKYTVYCSSDTTGGAFSSGEFKNGGYTQCIPLCDANAACTAWTWVPYSTTEDSGGVCYLKQEMQTRNPANNPGAVGGVLQSGNAPSTSPMIPGGPSVITMITQISDGSLSPGSATTPVPNNDPTTSARPVATATPCPYANGTELVSSSGKVYEVLCGVDESSDGAGTAVVEGDYALCVEECEKFTGCVSVTYSSFFVGTDQGFCVFRRTVGPVSPTDESDVHLILILGKSSSILYPTTTTMTTTSSSMAPSMSASKSSSMVSSGADMDATVSISMSTISMNGSWSTTSSQSSSMTSTSSEMDDDDDDGEEPATSTSTTWSSTEDGDDDEPTGMPESASEGWTSSSLSMTWDSSMLSSSSFSSMSASMTSSSSSAMPPTTSSSSSSSSPPGSSSSYASASSSSSWSTSYATGAIPPTSSSGSRSWAWASTSLSTSRSGYVTSMWESTASPSISYLTSASASALPPDGRPECDSTFTDPWGVTYFIKCKSDSSSGAFRTVPIFSGGFSACFGPCASTQGCNGFTYVGEDSGSCYLKGTPGNYIPKEGNNFVTAFKIESIGYSITIRQSISNLGVSSSSSSVSSSSRSYSPASMPSVLSSSGTLSSSSGVSSLSRSSGSSMSGTGAPSSGSTMSSRISTVSTTGSSSTTSSRTSSTSYAPPPPCPTSVSYYCMESNQQTTCSAGGANYAVQCGIIYQGTEIDTSDINLMPGGRMDEDSSEEDDMEGMSMLVKKATIPDFQTCQNLCSKTPSCKAFNFVGNDCTLFSTVTGYSYSPGSLGGTVYNAGEAPPTPIDASPSCPKSAGKAFADSTGVKYNIVCYTDYSGGDLPTAQIGGDSIVDCLSTCNLNDLCAGAVFNTVDGLCRFKAAFNGSQTANNNLIAALRVGGPPAYSVPPTTVTTTLLPTSTLSLSSGATVTVSAPTSGPLATVTTTVDVTAPTGGSFTSSGTGSYYVYATSSSKSAASGDTGGGSTICFTCDLTPTVVPTDGDGAPWGPPSSFFTTPTGNYNPTCATRPHMTGTTTVFTTHTVTTCDPQPKCPNSGYFIYTGTSRPEQVIITTTDKSGSSYVYTQVPATITPSPSYTGGGGGGGPGTGPGSGPGTGPGSGPGTGPGSGPGTGPGSGPGSGPGTGPGTGPRTGPGIGPGTGPGTGPAPTITETTTTVSISSVIPTSTEPSCPANNGEEYTAQMGMIYTLLCDTGFTGEVLDTQTQDKLTSCISACDMYNVLTFYLGSQCLGVNYYPEKTRDNCALVANTVPGRAAGVVSARLLTPRGGGGSGNNTNPGDYGSMGSMTASPGPGTGPGTGPGPTATETTTTTAISLVPSTIYSVSTAVSTYVSNGVSYVTSYGVSTAISVSYGPASTRTVTTTTTAYVPSTVYSVSTAVSTYVSNGISYVTSYAVSTAVSVSLVPAPTQTVTTTTYVPSTIYETRTTVSTYVSNGISYVTSYGITTAVSVSYIPATASTNTVTTTLVSISVSKQTVSGPAVTASGSGGGGGTVTVTQTPTGQNTFGLGGTNTGPPQVVTITAGGGNFITVTLGSGGAGSVTATTTVYVTRTVAPSSRSTSSSFTCRTYATNYLNIPLGSEPTGVVKKREVKRSIFDADVVLQQNDMAPRPGDAPQLWYNGMDDSVAGLVEQPFLE